LVISRNGFNAIAVLDLVIRPLSGSTEELSRFDLRLQLAGTANAGIDDRHKHRSGLEVGRSAEQEASAVSNRKGVHLVRKVALRRLGVMPYMTPCREPRIVRMPKSVMRRRLAGLYGRRLR